MPLKLITNTNPNLKNHFAQVITFFRVRLDIIIGYVVVLQQYCSITTTWSISLAAIDDYMNVRQAARQLGVHPETVKRWIWDGKLLATKLGNAWFIDRSQLEIFRNNYNFSRGNFKRLL